jgi:hypothetical protein
MIRSSATALQRVLHHTQPKEPAMKAEMLMLQNGLKKFGLNPTEWHVHPLREKHYKIANVRDKKFYFLGEANTATPRPFWNQIILGSF